MNELDFAIQLANYGFMLEDRDDLIFNAKDFFAWLNHQGANLNHFWEQNHLSELAIITNDELKLKYRQAINLLQYKPNPSQADKNQLAEYRAILFDLIENNRNQTFYDADATSLEEGRYAISNHEFRQATTNYLLRVDRNAA